MNLAFNLALNQTLNKNETDIPKETNDDHSTILFLPWFWTLILDPSPWSWILILKDLFLPNILSITSKPPLLNTGSHFRVLYLLAACPTFKNMPSVKGTCTLHCTGCMCSVLEQKNVLWEVIRKSSVNCWTLVNSLLPAHFHIKFKDFQELTFLFVTKVV